MKKNRLFQLQPFVLLCVLSLTFAGCSPQHNYAFKQFNAPSQEAVLSIQGYVIVNPKKIEDLKVKWNALVTEMSKKPGFIDSNLSKGIGKSKLVLAHSKWKDLATLRNAFADKKIIELEAKLPKKQFVHLFNFGSLNNYKKK
ncbi:MAG TPA: hypothetical protein DCS93_08345 [Microscillaceae bacterium]|nr:hypothetical protein [Microscillaceae bacterium]